MKIIKKLFIKNYKDVENEKVRAKYGIVAGVYGIFTNLILFTGKIIVGLVSSSMSIIADAFNNLSDMASSVITILGFHLASKPADEKHPYGHARYEYLSSLLIACIILVIGFLLLKNSVIKIINKDITNIDYFTLIVLFISVLLKLFQMLVYKDFAKATKSKTLSLSAVDSRNDIITTIVVIVSSLIIYFFKDIPFSVDGITGVILSVFIIINSVNLVKDTISPLLGERADKTLTDDIKKFITSYDGVYGIHDLMIHNYGEKINFTTVHVEVSSNEDIMDSHELVDKIERDFKVKFGGVLTVHMDPIELDNKEVNDLRIRIMDILGKIDPRFSLHDLRIVSGKNSTNVIFDIVIPFSQNKVTKEYIIEKIDSGINTGTKHYNLVVNFDNE